MLGALSQYQIMSLCNGSRNEMEKRFDLVVFTFDGSFYLPVAEGMRRAVCGVIILPWTCGPRSPDSLKDDDQDDSGSPTVEIKSGYST